MRTYLAKVVENRPGGQMDAEAFARQDWREWRNVNPADSLPAAILYRWIRDRGGLDVGERLRVTVYHTPKDGPKHPNGAPMTYTRTVFDIRKNS